MTNDELKTYAEKLEVLVERRAVPESLGPIECRLYGYVEGEYGSEGLEAPEHAISRPSESDSTEYLWVEDGLTEWEASEIDGAMKRLTVA